MEKKPFIRVRPAHLKDAGALHTHLVELFAERLPVLYDHTSPSLTEEIEFLEEIEASERSILLAAEKDGAVVGFLDLRGHERPQQAHAGVVGMSVDREHRSSGVGRALIEALVEWVERERRVSRVELEVFANNEPAIALYRKTGFREEGRKRGAVRVNGELVDMILMARVWG